MASKKRMDLIGFLTLIFPSINSPKGPAHLHETPANRKHPVRKPVPSWVGRLCESSQAPNEGGHPGPTLEWKKILAPNSCGVPQLRESAALFRSPRRFGPSSHRHPNGDAVVGRGEAPFGLTFRNNRLSSPLLVCSTNSNRRTRGPASLNWGTPRAIFPPMFYLLQSEEGWYERQPHETVASPSAQGDRLDMGAVPGIGTGRRGSAGTHHVEGA